MPFPPPMRVYLPDGEPMNVTRENLADGLWMQANQDNVARASREGRLVVTDAPSALEPTPISTAETLRAEMLLERSAAVLAQPID